MLLRRFFPMYLFNSIQEIPFEILEKENIKAIILDMDNTLVDYKYKYVDEVENWLSVVKSKNIKLCILTNSPMKSKVKKISEKLGMSYIINASKPWLKGFEKATKLLDTDKENIVIIGDQVFTDIWGGNRFGIKTILVAPIAKKEWIGTRIKRPIERYVLKKYQENMKVQK